jgi:hypothetical protein
MNEEVEAGLNSPNALRGKNRSAPDAAVDEIAAPMLKGRSGAGHGTHVAVAF